MATTFIVSEIVRGMTATQHPITGEAIPGIRGIAWDQILPEQKTVWQDPDWFSPNTVKELVQELLDGLKKMKLNLSTTVQTELVRALMSNDEITIEGYYPSRDHLLPKYVVIEEKGQRYTLSDQRSEIHPAFQFVNTKLLKLIGDRQHELDVEQQKLRLEKIDRDFVEAGQRIFKRIENEHYFLTAFNASKTSGQTPEDYWEECRAFIDMSDEEAFVNAVKAGTQRLL